jgi:sulfite dehydrogenase (quinone) subunit SoeC
MNPAYSVILFTTASGAGYGLLALLGLAALSHGQASSFAFAATSLVIALALITVGLLSSTLHLGHPERAWRAFSQWRSSWLSREGVAAVATYPVAFAFGAVWSGLVDAPNWIAPLGLLTAVMCLITVYCTAMIYRSLRTIRQWNHKLVVPVYLLWGLATGATLLAAISTLFDRYPYFQGLLTTLFLIVLCVVKIVYWIMIDVIPRTHTTGEATGLGKSVRMWEVPHTNTNFIQKEMGFVVARKHTRKLRKLTVFWLFAAILLMLLAGASGGWTSILAAALAFAAAITERWLFFAEAEHFAMVYYDRAAV